mmetsp:Transcript_22379/g.27638  ORF Transcript_22379/g.27638 Transcript_22379/m.27638 type:complete len:197 (+) Transcript_22379:78-668(+)|eukprot:CAMPEP_0172509406 /NCGR_PEP_ID=MMETSP1066-20121228/220063_1 /TAXON_ID=671091 /ORGANISM="Coscinodiscus wailesii, Strain CCMP2513" /LENGTH=196 /DNA_ID=CAMNT_0013287867 /DNA_START=67 /DNA_END=657 /DNA_ORIENTATION=+
MMLTLKRTTPLLKHAKSVFTSRPISSGTNIITESNISAPWQTARPWHNEESQQSNLAVDNTNTMTSLFQSKKVAVFGVPAPFTGVCTNAHVPGYKALADEFLDKGGCDALICYAVTDPYTHYNWAEGMGVDQSKITFLADVDGSWAKEFGLDRDYAAVSLGVRSERFSMVVEDGIVKSFNVVEDAVKDAEVLLSQL